MTYDGKSYVIAETMNKYRQLLWINAEILYTKTIYFNTNL